jgi:hypothetical protein
LYFSKFSPVQSSNKNNDNDNNIIIIQPAVEERPEIVGFSLSIPLIKDTPVGIDEERHLKCVSFHSMGLPFSTAYPLFCEHCRNKLLINYKRFLLDAGAGKEDPEAVKKELMDEQVEADKHLLGMVQKACQYAIAQ